MLEVYMAPCRKGQGHALAHALLAEAYQRHVGVPMPALARTAEGKPYFPDGSLHFSLSHTGTMALCAISDQEVGADAETVRPVRRGLPERVLTAEELDWLARQEDRKTAFFALWTGKEAWVKLTGRGLQWRPRDVGLFCGGDAPAVDGAALTTHQALGAVITVCTRAPEAAAWTVLPDDPGTWRGGDRHE